ncbi:MAG: glycosyltransferase [Lachnospiraceae bacterium]|nr:glycosyltransferase [Lachnospiraceae bacterium]
MVNIIIFGIGKMYEVRKSFFEENRDRINIVAFLDNNPEFQGKQKDGVAVYAPEKIEGLHYDCVLLLSKQYMKEMKDQLLSLGVSCELIWELNTLKLMAFKGKRTLYGGKTETVLTKKEKILIISTEMGFNGGTMVAVYAAMALRDKGYEVMLSAPCVDERLLEEVVQEGLQIMVWDCLPYVFEEDRDWICRFDMVIVNVFQMMNCAYEISKIRPVLWWIHEDRSIWKSFYQDTQREFRAIDYSDWMSRVEVMGVSSIAKEAFNHFYPSVVSRSLPFGIPDRFTDEGRRSEESKIVFAVTAGFSVYKGQRILVNALKKLTQDEKTGMEIWFIGPEGKNQEELAEICDERENMKFLGLLSHEEVIEILPQIDVLVCPSLIETMSMSTIEGMMFGKICITTDMTGISEYIEDTRNGFVVKAGDSDQLAERISWVINNRDKWDAIQRAARETYETEFCMEKFGGRLETELKACAEKYYKKKESV